MRAQTELGLFLLNRHLKVVWVSEPLVRYFQIPRGEILHHDIRLLLRETLGDAFMQPERFINTVLESYNDGTYVSELTCQTRSAAEREERWLEYTSRPLYGGKHAGGRIECYLDITGERRAQQSQSSFYA